jgi:hypothetical protein
MWMMFLVMSMAHLNIRRLPAAGTFILIALAIALLAPVVATALAGVALAREPWAMANRLTFACAGSALVGQVVLFLGSSFL